MRLTEKNEKEGLAEETRDHFTETERDKVQKDTEISRLTERTEELVGKVAGLSEALSRAVSSYKAMVVRANPDIIEELISGDTIESIDESLTRGKELVSKVKQGMETAVSREKVPAGAPERTLPDLSTLSAREKIHYAISSK